jgi:hypothetical protein
MPIDKQLRSFNFYILTRGTHCSQGLKSVFLSIYPLMHKTRLLNVVENKISKQKLLKHKCILTHNKHTILVLIVF